MGSHSSTQANLSLPYIWEKGQTSAYYCRKLPGGEADTSLYCLVTDAHMCELLAQGHYLAVHWAGIEPGISGSPV